MRRSTGVEKKFLITAVVAGVIFFTSGGSDICWSEGASNK